MTSGNRRLICPQTTRLYNNQHGCYSKKIIESFVIDETSAEYTILKQGKKDETEYKKLWLFSRIDEGRRYSVGFFVDNEDHLLPVNEPAFCYFPTKEDTGLKFIIHAPFLLNDSREGIKAGQDHNKEMLQKLAALSADSIIYLRDIGEKRKIRFIDDKITDIIPYDPKKFSPQNNKSKGECRREIMSDGVTDYSPSSSGTFICEMDFFL